MFIIKLETLDQLNSEVYPFINNKYTPCEELFPEWIGAREFLIDYCNGIEGWDIRLMDIERFISINIIYPSYIYPEYSDIEYDKILTLLPKEREKIVTIRDRIVGDYADHGFLEDQLYCVMDEILILRVLAQFEKREQVIISMGGRSLLDEFRFRLGVLY